MNEPSVDETWAELLEAIVSAWLVEGPNPRYHREQKAHLWRMWPSLARACADAAER